MARAYSTDLRQRVVNNYLQGGGSYEAIAERYDVGRATVSRWLRRYRTRAGDLGASMHLCGRKPSLSPEQDAEVLQVIQEQPDRTLEALRDAVSERLGRPVTPGILQGALQRLNITLKKRP